MTTYVFFKDGSDSTLSLNLPLEAGETVLSVTEGAITPAPALPPFTAAVVSGPGPVVLLTVTGGVPDVTYGVPLTVVTDVRSFIITAAVSVSDSVFVPYRAQDPDSYTDLIGNLEAGKAALSTCIFTFPASIDPTGGNIEWELLDHEGVVYSAGNAFSYRVQNNGVTQIVIGQSVVSAPTDTPSSLDKPYQLRYTLRLNNPQDGVQNSFYSYENIVITGLTSLPVGTSPSVELHGDDAHVGIVLDQAYSNVLVELYRDNDLIASSPIPDAMRVSSGYYYAGVFNTQALPTSLIPYRLVWKYSMSVGPTYRDSTSLWVVNPSILSAIEDCKAKINKARTTLYGTDDHQFPNECILTWLRRAADSFNGAYGVFTSFTFLNAKGVIREFWLLYSELFALESQYLAEGEKAFNFQGANISLDVDRTQYLDGAASKIQSRLDAEVKPLKQNLIIKGCVGGDGSADPYRLQRGAIGAVGITIHQASPFSQFIPILPRRM